MVNSIKISELRDISNSIFDHIENTLNTEVVHIENSCYWSVSDNARYDLRKEPSDYEMGDLLDDIEFLKDIIENKENAVPAMLIHLAPILVYLSSRIDWYPPEC